MKVTLPSGQIFEGNIEEFKEYMDTHSEIYMDMIARGKNKQLIDIISKNDPRNLSAPESKLTNKTTCVLSINEDMSVVLNVSETQEIRVYFLTTIDEANLLLIIDNFNSNRTKEIINFSYNQKSFSFVIDKEKTTNEEVFLLETKFTEDEEIWKNQLSNVLLNIEKVAKFLILNTLKTLNKFIIHNSSSLSLKDFGYINF